MVFLEEGREVAGEQHLDELEFQLEDGLDEFEVCRV